MIKILIKIFIKDYGNISDNLIRVKYASLSGIIGIICNLLLFVLKITAGTVAGSIAVISDAFNNLSDMGSSLVTLIGAKLSRAGADREHPFGHGRIEYISSLIISFIILLAGFELLKSSAVKIFNPTGVKTELLTIFILIISIAVKIWMYSYNRYMSKVTDSKVLEATALDSRNDVLTTLAVLMALILNKFIPFEIDGYAGAAVSLFIMYSGYMISKDTIGILLGAQPDEALVTKIEKYILDEPEILGIHDLVIHDYGPGRTMASVHAEVSADCSLLKIHEVIDTLEKLIEKETKVHIVVHIDPVGSECEESKCVIGCINEQLNNLGGDFSIHDFKMSHNEDRIDLFFDLCIPGDTDNETRNKIIKDLKKKLKERDKRYNAIIRIDNMYR